jgi:hypothetical protein
LQTIWRISLQFPYVTVPCAPVDGGAWTMADVQQENNYQAR